MRKLVAAALVAAGLASPVAPEPIRVARTARRPRARVGPQPGRRAAVRTQRRERRRTMKKTLALALAAVAACTAAAAAQRVHEVPARPELWAGADTNSAGAYYLLGVQRLERDARMSAAAFYWAERLAPGWPDALYGRYVALLMSDPHRLEQYEQRRGGIERNPEIMAIDSLYYRAVQRDPFLHRKFEKPYVMMYYRNAYAEMIRQQTGDRDEVAADYLMRQLMNDHDP